MSSEHRFRAAFATRNGRQVDSGFEQARQLVIYEIDVDEAIELDRIAFAEPVEKTVERPKLGKCGPGGGGGCGGTKKKDKEESINEAQVAERVVSISGAAVLIVNKALHAYSALELNLAHVFTVKIDDPEPIADVIARLQQMIATRPPLWLQKALAAKTTPAV